MDADISFDAVFAKLRAFSELPAFELLSTAKCLTYFGGISEAVADLSLSELAELSSLELRALGMSETDCQVILQQLSPLVVKAESNDVGVNSNDEVDQATSASADNTNPGMTLSSVAQEQLLTNILNELAAWPQLEVYGNEALGKFWVDKNVRAPFEELITLRQLAHMSVRSLLAKRSMTGEKIVAITNAAKQAMQGLRNIKTSAKESLPSSPVLDLTKTSRTEDSSLTQRLLAAALKELSPAQRARVLTSVAMPEDASSSRRKSSKAKSRKSRIAKKTSKKKSRKANTR